MSRRVRDEPDEAEYEGEDDGDGLDAVYEAEHESEDDEEEEPLTHLADEDYERFVATELAGAREGDGHPPVAAILVGLTLLIIVVVMLLA